MRLFSTSNPHYQDEKKIISLAQTARDELTELIERDRDAAFDRLAGAGAELVTTEMVLFEWLRSCEHEAFKDMLALVK